MGCGSSVRNAVQPLGPEDVNGDEDETGSKLDGRGDSAVSKGTTDSGVGMEKRERETEIPQLPGEVRRESPLLARVGGRQGDGPLHDGKRPKSSEILQELLNQGIIPMGEKEGAGGEAYSIMLDNRVRRRPPARLESLKTSKTQQRLPSREEIEEKIRSVEERRKLKEDELKTRLRTKSARVRVRGPAPSSSTELDPDEDLTPVEDILHPLTPEPPPLQRQVLREEAEGGENVRGAAGDGRERREEMGGADGREKGGEDRGVEDEEEGLTEVEELKQDELLAALEELENDSSFQSANDKEETF